MYRGIIAIVTVIIAIITWTTALGIPAFFSWKKQKYFLINIFTTILLISLLFFYPIRAFIKITIEMWNNDVYQGSIRNSEYSTLQWIHILFILMFFILVITLWIRLFSRFSYLNWLSTLSSIIFLICINISFFYTIPRNGDDSFAWIFLLPWFFFADLILIVTIILFTISSIIRQIKSNNPETEITKTPKSLNEELTL